jgi:hypothetical protein
MKEFVAPVSVKEKAENFRLVILHNVIAGSGFHTAMSRRSYEQIAIANI